MTTKAKRLKTATLMNRLFKAANINDYLSANNADVQEISFCDRISELCEQKGLKRAQVIRDSKIERSYAYQLFAGRRRPSRDKLLMLCFGMGLDVDETQALLKATQMSELYPKIKRDAVILFCMHRCMGVNQTQEMLESLSLTLLGEGEA